MVVDWKRLESMFSAYGLDNLASEARHYGQASELRQQISQSTLRIQKQQVEHMLKQAREAERQSRRQRPKPGDTATGDPMARAANVSFSNLPVDIQGFVDAIVRQAEVETLYTTQGKTARGVPYECTASMYQESLNGIEERYVALLIKTESAAGKSTVTFRRMGSTWIRVED